MATRRKICFVAPYIYPLFNPDVKTMFGGFEVRIATIARALIQRGNFDVTIVTADHGQPERETREGIAFIAWKGKAFYGIAPQPASPSALELSPVPAAPDIAPPPASGAAEVYEVREYTGDGAPRLRSRMKRRYKQVVPWRARIVVTALAHSLKQGLKEIALNWSHAARLVLWGVRAAVWVFRDRVGRALRIARTAVGHMVDLPVFQEQIQIFADADADIYIVPGNSLISAEAAFYCNHTGRAFVMLVGSDMDLNPEYLLNPNGVDLYSEPNAVKLYTVQNAAAHIVQNERQLELARRYGVSPVLVRNPLNLEQSFPRSAEPGLVLWVGSTDERVKRPSVMLETARRLPQYQFLMIVTPTVQAVYEQLCQDAEAIPNLAIISRVPFSEVEKYYAQAALFVNTSSFEGFPNTFLQAGKYGVPIVSLKVDPNALLSEHGCGVLCDDRPDLLAASIQRLMDDAGLREEAGRKILAYVRQYHDLNVIIPQLEEQFQAALARKNLV